MNVHDAGSYAFPPGVARLERYGLAQTKLEPGMVLTVEPGIYIAEKSTADPKWWNIGVRIEDVVLVTAGRHGVPLVRRPSGARRHREGTGRGPRAKGPEGELMPARPKPRATRSAAVRTARPSGLAAAGKSLRDFAMGLPGATEEFPWGERVAKVGGKVFVFLGKPARDVFGLSVKLPLSKDAALDLPFTAPTGYGLGKAGWVTASFGPSDRPPVEVLKGWIEESYRAVAPKKLVAALEIR